ncbi:MAG: hypothetical protein IQL11_06440 [Bacteroidales bacterium]|nr:hypothetical protein [Bacteroidales bacterium]
MSEINDTKNVKDNEIDLLDLFRRMGRAIGRMSRAIGKAVLISIVFLFRRWLPLTLSIFMGIGAAYILKLTSASFYTSDLILRTNSGHASDMIAYINRLHRYCEEKNFTALADAVSLNDKQVRNITDIRAFWIIDRGNDGIPDEVDFNENTSVYDTVNVRMRDRFDIRVQLKQPQELVQVKNGLIKYIYSDSLFQQLNRIRLRHNMELLARFENDILLLDSLQKVKYFEETRSRMPQTGDQMIFLQEQKTQLVYTDIYALYARKQAVETEQEIYKDIVTVLSEFSIPTQRVNGGRYYAIRVVPIIFGLTLLILLILANKKKLREVYQKYQI